MTSIERTAYPRFGRLVTARELVELAPTPDEVTWARDRTRSDAHLLALVVSLKCFQLLGCFLRPDQVPEVVVDHLRRRLELADETAPELGSERTAKTQEGPMPCRGGVRILAVWVDETFGPVVCSGDMSRAGGSESHELVVADDGSIPAEQLRGLRLRPGAHLRVVEAALSQPLRTLAGSLPNLPDLSWEDFEQASAAARRNAATSCG